MDNTVKIWSMKEFWTYVEKSFTWTDLPSKFPTKYVQFPSVDNEIVLWEPKTKEQNPGESVDNEIVLWEPKTKEQNPGEGSVDILQKYSVPECDIWFIKFSCDFHYNAATIDKMVEKEKNMKRNCITLCLEYVLSRESRREDFGLGASVQPTYSLSKAISSSMQVTH